MRGTWLNLWLLLQFPLSGHDMNFACSFYKVFFFPQVFLLLQSISLAIFASPVWKLCWAGPASSWYLSEAPRHYHSTIVSSNCCFLKTFPACSLTGGCCYLCIPVSPWSSRTLCNSGCLVTCLAHNTYLTSDPWIERVLLSVITCGLCCLLVCGLVFSPSVCVFSRMVLLVLIKAITQLEIGRLSRICCSHLTWTDFTLLQPQWSFLDWWGWVISIIHYYANFLEKLLTQ